MFAVKNDRGMNYSGKNNSYRDNIVEDNLWLGPKAVSHSSGLTKRMEKGEVTDLQKELILERNGLDIKLHDFVMKMLELTTEQINK